MPGLSENSSKMSWNTAYAKTPKSLLGGMLGLVHNVPVSVAEFGV